MIDKSYIFTEFIKGNKIICVDLFSGISQTPPLAIFNTFLRFKGNRTSTVYRHFLFVAVARVQDMYRSGSLLSYRVLPQTHTSFDSLLKCTS